MGPSIKDVTTLEGGRGLEDRDVTTFQEKNLVEQIIIGDFHGIMI
jgi:hypothetical protein